MVGDQTSYVIHMYSCVCVGGGGFRSSLCSLFGDSVSGSFQEFRLVDSACLSVESLSTLNPSILLKTHP